MQEAEFIRITEGLFQGERLALSKAITLCESDNPSIYPYRDRLLEAVETKNTGLISSFRLAVTGVPGAGKSTLINALGMEWIRQGHKVAVLAIDPSSEQSMGSVLGDKTRMTELSRQEKAFIRPSPTRLHLGGVASSTYETIMLCEAAGYDRILVETVGVGQSELEASRLTDACLLLLLAGTGDELQSVKRGILETADLIFVNKADGDNQEKASKFALEIKQISGLWGLKNYGKNVEVCSGSSLSEDNIQALCHQLEILFSHLQELEYLTSKRRNQTNFRIPVMLKARLDEMLLKSKEWKNLLEEVKIKINSSESKGLFAETNNSAQKLTLRLLKNFSNEI